ncbi:MAG: hypothetical protein IIB40_03465 [Candidatus Marinimicrobia bacterium]|nr:hypothetical protein [Candidatus Neomarinimicrobiota bacterium]
MTKFKKQIRLLFDIREGEGKKVTLMFSLIFFLIASLLIIKPVRNSLFLIEIGAAKLPYAYILVALFSAGMVAFFMEYSKKFHIGRLTRSVLNISILSLFAFWLLLHYGIETKLFIYVLYVWVALFGVMTTMQFWLLSNYVFTTRQAKRLFGLIGAGGISGGIFGGYLTNFLAPFLGTKNLLLLSASFLVICIYLGKYAWVLYGRKNYSERFSNITPIETTAHEESSFKIIGKSKYLILLSSTIGISVLVANLVDYQFNTIALQNINNENELTAFFGFWLSNLSIFSLLFQLFFSGKIINLFGMRISLLFLPLSLLIGSVAIFVYPVIFSALLMKVSSGAFKQSINKSARELLFIPITAEIKNKVKVFIDVFIANFATGLSGVLLLLITLALGFSVQQISIISIFLIFIWSILIYKIKAEYVDTFRTAIEKRSINLEEQQVNLNDATLIDSLLNVLDSSNDNQVLYVLGLLENFKSENLIPHLKRLLNNSSRAVKTQVLKMLDGYSKGEFYESVLPLVNDPDLEVKINAISYLYGNSDDPDKLIGEYIKGNNLQTKIAAMMSIAEEYRTSSEFRERTDIESLFNGVFSDETIKPMSTEEADLMRIYSSNFIGISSYPGFYPYLYKLMESDSAEVRKSALINMGETCSTEFLPTIIETLNDRKLQKYARDVLAGYCDDAVPLLVERLQDTNENQSIKNAIPGILGKIYSDETTHALSDYLLIGNRALRFEMIKSLNKLNARFPEIETNTANVNKAIIEEIEYYYKLSAIISVEKIQTSESNNNGAGNIQIQARQLLVSSLRDKIENTLERIFRLLGLKYSSSDMYNTFLGIVSNNLKLKENAIELLDNILSHKLKLYVIPIIDMRESEQLLTRAKLFFDIEFKDEEECIFELLNGDDDWLKTCSIYLASTLNISIYEEKVKDYLDDSHPVLRETANLALNN